MSEPLKWIAKSTETVFKDSFLHLHKDLCCHPTLGSHNFYVFDFRNWVNIVPVTSDGDIILVRQYRRGTDEITLEIPAGSMDAGEEDPLSAAHRELREETGYTCHNMELLYKVAVNPAIQNNYCYLYLATQCEYTGPTQLDDTEEIEVLVLPPREVRELIARNEITHSLGLLGLVMALQKLPE